MTLSISQFLKLEISKTLSSFNVTLSPIHIDRLLSMLLKDLRCFASKDPSNGGDLLLILETNLAYKAVLYYRIANYFYYNNKRILARKLSETAKVITHIEIHPAAKIGKNFVIDHGTGTVIGETTEIGDNCYLLQNIILGSKNIIGNPCYLRHPILGNNVEVGGSSKILGRVTIGNNVKISPHAIITQNIDDNSTVLVTSLIQITKNKHKLIFTGYHYEGNNLILHLTGLSALNVTRIKCYSSTSTCYNQVDIAKDKLTIINYLPKNDILSIKFFDTKNSIHDLKVKILKP